MTGRDLARSIIFGKDECSVVHLLRRKIFRGVIVHLENVHADACWRIKTCLGTRAEEKYFNANTDHKDYRDRDDMMRAHWCLL